MARIVFVTFPSAIFLFWFVYCRGEIILMIPTLSDAPMHYVYMNEWYPTQQGSYRTAALNRITQRDLDSGSLWYRRFSGDDEDDARVEPLSFAVSMRILIYEFIIRRG